MEREQVHLSSGSQSWLHIGITWGLKKNPYPDHIPGEFLESLLVLILGFHCFGLIGELRSRKPHGTTKIKAHGFYPRDFELTCPAWAHALLCFKSSPSGSIVQLGLWTAAPAGSSTDSFQRTQQFVIYSAQRGSVSVVSDISCLWVLVALQIMEQIAMVLSGCVCVCVCQTWVILAGILKNMDPGKKTDGAVERGRGLRV